MADDETAAQLTQAGLLVWSEGNASGPTGYAIAKPTTVKGNARPNYQLTLFSLDGDDALSDAPISYLRWREGCWCHEVAEYAPGPGPGDFRQSYPSFEAAVQAVLSYYFGDPTAMNPPDLDSPEPADREANPLIRSFIDAIRRQR